MKCTKPYNSNQKKEASELAKQIDCLKREFVFIDNKEITIKKVIHMAGVEEKFGYKILKGRTSATPSLKKLQKAFFDLSHSKKIKQRFS